MDQRSQAAAAMRGATYGESINMSLLSLFEPGSSVLDIGCGTGAWAGALRAKGARRLVGVEISPAAADAASTRYDEIRRDPIEDLVFDTGSFDTIIVADVFEHLLDPWAELHRCRDWAAKGGQIVVSVPNIQSIDILGPLLAGRFEYRDGGGLMDRTHLRWFTHRSLSEALRAAGWSPEVFGHPTAGKRASLSRATGRKLDSLLQRQIQVVASAPY